MAEKKSAIEFVGRFKQFTPKNVSNGANMTIYNTFN